jgi:hypothetical protein
MRRGELRAAIEHVLEAFEESGLERYLLTQTGSTVKKNEEPSASRDPSGDTTEALRVLNRFTIISSAFGDAEKKILTIFGFDRLLDVKFWLSRMLRGGGATPGGAAEVAQDLLFLKLRLPKVVQLLDQDSDLLRNQVLPEGEKTKLGLLTVIVIEPDGARSRPQRLVGVLESVAGMYEVAAALESAPTDDLVVVSCDSGSDKSFDFLGAAQVVEGVRRIIFSIWDRVVFYREHKLTGQLQLVAQSLPVLDRIAELESGGRISPEQAEILRRKVLGSATQFVAAGAIIPELNAVVADISPRQLMAPEPKMLVGKVEATGDGTSGRARKKKPKT